MAIELILQYPNRVGTPDADYPYGVPRNRSAPGATDGTPYEQAWYRDQEGFFQGMLFAAGIEPSGNPDTVLESDYLDALTQIASGITEVDMAGDQNVTLAVGPSRISALKLTGALAADVELIVPDTERFYWIVDETTSGFNVTVKTSAGTGVEVLDDVIVVKCDGTDVGYAGPAARGSGYDNTTSGLTASDVQAAIDEIVATGAFEKATTSQAEAGVNDTTYMTPLKVNQQAEARLAGLNLLTGRHEMYDGDLDTLFTKNSVYNFAPTATNRPPNMDGWGFVQTFMHKSSQSFGAQLAISMNNNGIVTLAARQKKEDAVEGWVDLTPIGEGQTWQDVSGSRAADTIYTNTTGRTIVISVGNASGSGASARQVFVDGVLVGEIDPVTGGSCSATVPVPDGSTYEVRDQFNSWAELR